MKTTITFLSTLLLSLPAFATTSETEWLRAVEQCWSQADVRFSTARVANLMKDYTRPLTTESELTLTVNRGVADDRGSCFVTFAIPVKTENDRCEGVNTLAFAMGGRSTFAEGPLENWEGRSFNQLFQTYKGKAIGLGLGAGYGRWSSSSDLGVRIKDSMGGIPLPALGIGNLALGVTSCRTHFELQPASDEVKITLRTRVNGVLAVETKSIPLSQIIDFPL